jgi:hypothetical protein
MFIFSRRERKTANHQQNQKLVEHEDLVVPACIQDTRDDDHCKILCNKANVEFLQCIHDHVIEYLNETIVEDWSREEEEKEDSGDDESKSSDSSKFKNNCSYEDWIRKCHPENTSVKDIDKKYHGYEIDHRFYLRDSDHRIIWNGYVHAFGCPELKVSPKSRVKDIYYFEGIKNANYLEECLGEWGIEQ